MDDICMAVVRNVSGSIACGVVNPDTGELLGIHQIEHGPSGVGKMMSKTVYHLVRSNSIEEIERLVRASRGLPSNEPWALGELFFSTETRFHFFRELDHARLVLMLITYPSANIGMAWVQMKAACSALDVLIGAQGAGRVA